MRHPLDWLAGNTSIPRAELRWAAGFAALVMAATCLPYLYGIAITPPGLRYMGFLGNPDESNVYMGWMRQAMEGHWLFRDPFTTEPQPGRFLNVFFLALGLVARALLPVAAGAPVGLGADGALLGPGMALRAPAARRPGAPH
jgi:hypothetical protein